MNKHQEKGFILSLVMMLLVILTMFGIAVLLMSATDIQQAGNTRMDQTALDVAYGKYQKAVSFLERNSCQLNGSGPNLLDTDNDGYVDSDDAVATSVVMCENQPDGKIIITGTFKSCANPSTERNHFTIKASGIVGNSRKTIVAKVEHKSFLHYARFCEGSISYAGEAEITGELYSGGNLSVTNFDTFRKDVTLRGTLEGEGSLDNGYTGPGTRWQNCLIEGVLTENYQKTLSLNIGAQTNDFEEDAISCGWNITDATGRNCLGNSDDSGSDNLLDLTRLKDLDGVSGTPRYEGPDCTYTLPQNFNGIIFWNVAGVNLHLSGTLGSDNKGKSTTIFSRSSIYIDDDVLSGVNSYNQPVNLGIVVDGNNQSIYISRKAPRFVTIKAALMSAQSNWQALGNDADARNPHFCGPNYNNPCTYDMNGNGVIENPNGWGYNEASLVPNNAWMLRFVGPIITKTVGSAGRYIRGGSQTTREYGYDVDILAFPPPYPIIKNLLHFVSYTETEEQI